MRILVAGGAGFIGSNLCSRLLGDGAEVYCVDNLLTASTRNVRYLQMNRKFRLLQASVQDISDFEVDQIYNLASPAAPGDYKAHPKETMAANVAGTERLLRMAATCGARMLHASTIRVLEDVPEDSPHFSYVEGKRKAERLCRKYYDKGTNVVIARLYNTYGPNMSKTDSRVVPQFVMRALRGEPLILVGNGEQKDSFCYVDDMLDGLIAYMNSDIAFGPMEFGYPKMVSIYELAELAKRVIHSDSLIMLNGQGTAINADRPVPDIREAQTSLGWNPRITLETGLSRLAEYYRGAA